MIANHYHTKKGQMFALKIAIKKKKIYFLYFLNNYFIIQLYICCSKMSKNRTIVQSLSLRECELKNSRVSNKAHNLRSLSLRECELKLE